MIFDNPAELKERIEHHARRRVRGEVPIFEDTSNYMSIYGGCVLRLGGDDFYVLGDTREGRFGIDDQPKYWVKYAMDLTTGERRIIKLVFYEEFDTELGLVKIKCRRRPEKESEILEKMRGHPRFMQGRTVRDTQGNPVRIIEHIRGKSLYVHLEDLDEDHETYYHETLPRIMPEVIASIEALAELHAAGQHHGDVRNDHLFIDREREGRYRWIDFDYWVNYADYDLWGVGNVLLFVVGKGIHTYRGVTRNPEHYPQRQGDPGEDDACLLAGYRIANLRRLFPYVSPELNDVLLRYSAGAELFYETLEGPVADLKALFG